MKLNLKRLSLMAITGVMAVTLGAAGITQVFASSHREAPMIAGDPKADATDLYAFVSPDKPDTVTLIANYLPFQEPAGGPNFYQFGDDVLYEIKVDNNGDAVEDVTFQYRFKTTIKNPNTFLYNTGPITSLDDPDWNISQSYTLTKVQNGQSTVLGENLPTTPSNVGPKSTPDFAALQQEAIKQVGGLTTFAGQSEDPFYADLGGLFDLLTIRELPGNEGGGIDGLKGYNVQSLALQVPISELTHDGSVPADATAANAVIGAWTTSSRQSTSVLNGDGTQSASGDFVQVSRLGAPLVNEVVIPLGDKDRWNSSEPKDDAQFANYVANPELGTLLKSIYNVDVPPQGAFGNPEARDDLVAIFLTGLPGLTKPENVVPSEQLRLNVGIAPSANPNRLGVLAGDNAGYPNGRRLADDVVDISIQAVAGAAYPLFHPEFTPDPLATQLGDGVPANDKAFRGSFPYLALPYSGFESIPHANAPSPTSSTPVTPPATENQTGDNGQANTSNRSEAALALFHHDAIVARNAFVESINNAQKQFASSNTGDNARNQLINATNQAKDQYSNQLNMSRDRFMAAITDTGDIAPAPELPEMKTLESDAMNSIKLQDHSEAIRSALQSFDESLSAAKAELSAAHGNGKGADEARNQFNDTFNRARDAFANHVSAAGNKL
ncbi:MAG TPA: DUF4331 domain-containing protein [Candidatus Limnocylindrales bacterium]|nr:DUF4331 domain-containing protein [Candidatus Limnocylindrales bacterium]